MLPNKSLALTTAKSSSLSEIASKFVKFLLGTPSKQRDLEKYMSKRAKRGKAESRRGKVIPLTAGLRHLSVHRPYVADMRVFEFIE